MTRAELTRLRKLRNAPASTLESLRPVTELAAGRPHGDRLRYMAGCKCDSCRRANTAYETARAKARKAGLANGIVSAAPTRAHLLALSRVGVGYKQVADAAKVAVSILGRISSGHRPRCRAATERAVLAVTAAAAADHALVDAGPTWKLLDDLIATGYSKAQLARELGYWTPAIQIKRTQCIVRTAYEVQRLHARLRRVPAKETLGLIGALREEGYRADRIYSMLDERAIRDGLECPDLTVHNGFIDAAAADLVCQLHAEITAEVTA